MIGPVLSARGLGVDLGGRPVLRDVGFDVGAGELVAVIGPNGAGKSTLFRALCGLVSHTGTVAIGGDTCHHRRDRMGVAYIPQRSDIDLDFPITVAQVVAGGRRRFSRVARRPGPTDRAAVAAALDRVGLSGCDRRALGSLSGGQAQRAFLARALAQEAGVVLLDEALSGVDSGATELLLDVFAALQGSGTTLLVATHDLALARRRFGRCLALNGRLVGDGVPITVLDAATLDATFGSAAALPLAG